MKKWTSVLCMLAAAVMLTAGCGSDQKAAAPAQPNKNKTLIVATNPSFAPFEFMDKDKMAGFDIDLISAMVKQAGYQKVEFKSLPFDGLIPALENGNIDIAVGGISITDARKQKVNFTDSYYESGLMAIVGKDNDSIKSLEDLKGKTIAAQIGTVGADEANKIEGAKVKTFDSSDLACLELKNGGADAVISDLPVLQYFLKKGGSAYAKSVGTPKKGDFYGFAVAKKNTALCDQLNKALAELKKNGEYQKIYDKWFGEAK